MADVPQIYQTKLQRAQKVYRGGNYPLSLELASSFSEDQVYRAQSGTTFDLFEFKVRSLVVKCKFALKLPAEVVLDGECLLQTPVLYPFYIRFISFLQHAADLPGAPAAARNFTGAPLTTYECTGCKSQSPLNGGSDNGTFAWCANQRNEYDPDRD
jgi:hypothetical protein